MSIIRINESLEMQNVSNKLRSEGKSIAFVPTMGALHEGHLSLVDEACKKADEVVVSIFVNPKQFGPNEDYGEYIRDLEGDLKKLSKYKVGYLFNPGVKDIYNEGFQTYVVVEELQKFLCGKIRPGHFKGVSTVVLKLFNIVKPDFAVFGKKDYQQFKLIERMVKDLNLEIEIIGMPIIREESGLAMSSRNKYLSENEKKRASNIYKSLNIIKKLFYEGQNDCTVLINNAKKMLNMNQINDIDYLDIRNPETLEIRKKARKGDLIAIAVRVCGARLIDNIIL